ncbi:MAG TPA: hypothetical protein VNF71_12710 [Acidimicrobiales bacterium]|nr:hypothetical protein [Acidimicrobiales bacterium]
MDAIESTVGLAMDEAESARQGELQAIAEEAATALEKAVTQLRA